MIDPDFLEDLRRAPEPILAQYELTEDERVTVRSALDRLSSARAQHAYEFRNALLRRVAT